MGPVHTLTEEPRCLCVCLICGSVRVLPSKHVTSMSVPGKACVSCTESGGWDLGSGPNFNRATLGPGGQEASVRASSPSCPPPTGSREFPERPGAGWGFKASLDAPTLPAVSRRRVRDGAFTSPQQERASCRLSGHNRIQGSELEADSPLPPQRYALVHRLTDTRGEHGLTWEHTEAAPGGPGPWGCHILSCTE